MLERVCAWAPAGSIGLEPFDSRWIESFTSCCGLLIDWYLVSICPFNSPILVCIYLIQFGSHLSPPVLAICLTFISDKSFDLVPAVIYLTTYISYLIFSACYIIEFVLTNISFSASAGGLIHLLIGVFGLSLRTLNLTLIATLLICFPLWTLLRDWTG